MKRLALLAGLVSLTGIGLALSGRAPEPPPPPLEPFVPLTYSSTTTGPQLGTGQIVEGALQNGEAMSTALARLGVGAKDADKVVAALRPHFDWRVARPEHSFALHLDAQGLAWLRYTKSPTEIFHGYRTPEGEFRGLVEPVVVRTSTVFVEGTIDHSLYLAVEAAGEQAVLTLAFVDLFSWDVDFFTETQKGDRFRMLVEKRFVGRDFVGYGRIVAAEYKMSEARTHRAFLYATASGERGYYTADGASVKKAFLKSPIKFASITSRYGMRRHPVLNYVRAHRGVDYGAPRGTAIWAVGDGTVAFAGRQGGYGNVVILRHANGLETRYAHLHKFGGGIKSGRRVAQKDVIGYVGSTGLATGPHLHFEVLERGRHVNPLKIAAPPAPPIPSAEIERYRASIVPLVKTLEEGEGGGG